jgi:hypothetical protein
VQDILAGVADRDQLIEILDMMSKAYIAGYRNMNLATQTNGVVDLAEDKTKLLLLIIVVLVVLGL